MKPAFHVIPEPERTQFGDTMVPLTAAWALTCETPLAASLVDDYCAVLRLPRLRHGRPPDGPRFRLVSADMAAEAYRLAVSPAGGMVSANSEAGFRWALETLRQLRTTDGLPACSIDDAPHLPMRGFHVFLHRQMDFAALNRLLESAARFKLNTVVLEYESRFPYRRHPTVAGADALSHGQVEALTQHAWSLGLEPIALQQSLGHLDYLLARDAYAGRREEDQVRDQMCPLNPDSFALFTELAEDMLALHPGSRFLHVGGDETRHLGACARCQARAAEVGLAGLYGEYMAKVLGWVIRAGLRPIIWDDMLCAHPEALASVPRQTAIMYWDYWTVADPSPYLVARFDRHGRAAIVHDKCWGEEWPLGELTEAQRAVLAHFSAGVPLAEDLGTRFLDRYGAYLGPDFPRRLRAFPYLEYYQDQGFDVIMGPTAMGNHEMPDGLPHFARFYHNVHASATRARQNGRTLGMVTTTWYSFPPEMLVQGLVTTGQFAWSRR